MTALKAHEVERYLKKPDLSEGIFLAYGPDTGLVRETAQRLIQYYLEADSSSDGAITLDGAELEADPWRLCVEAKTNSLFGGRRVIRVRNAGKGLKTPLAELKDDPAGAIVILEAGNLTPKDGLRALVEATPKARALPCYPDSDEAVLKLIAETFAAAGIRLEANVGTLLRDTLGNDREVTRRELEKLTLFAAESKVLRAEDVIALCADNAALVLDEALDAAGTGHAEKLEQALTRALAAAVNPQQILIGALNHFSALRRWRAEIDSGRSLRDVLDGSRPKPHFSRRATLEQQLRLWNSEALAAANDRLHQAMAESRRQHDLAATILRRALLGIARSAAEH